MLIKNDVIQRDQLEMVALDQLVPQDHLVRKMEEAEHLRHKQEFKEIYAKRKEIIERVFTDAKEKHGMRWTTLRGLKKMSTQAMLHSLLRTFNKMANWREPKIT